MNLCITELYSSPPEQDFHLFIYFLPNSKWKSSRNFAKLKLCYCMCKFMSCFDRTLARLWLLARAHTTPDWIYFLSMLAPRRAPILPGNIRTSLMGDISNRPMYVLAGWNARRRKKGGGEGARRLPTVFNLSRMLLAFREDDKEINKPCAWLCRISIQFKR